jgi:hypothetical protein
MPALPLGRLLPRSNVSDLRPWFSINCQAGWKEMSLSLISDCGGPYDLTSEHTITCWEDMPTSPAESAIISYLVENTDLVAGKRLLHVGIGNSELPRALIDFLSSYVGITISAPEVDRFKRMFDARSNMVGLLINKYDQRDYPKIDGKFDLIVDTLLKSVACCEKHFDEMMRFFAGRLTPCGKIVTTENGVQFGWTGDRSRAYTPGAQIDPAVASARVLGRSQLEDVCRKYGLLTSVEETRRVGDRSDTILTLTRA